MTGGRVLHFGKYDGCEIERVVEEDPEYILWAANSVRGHGISQLHIQRARDLLDRYDTTDDEDLLFNSHEHHWD